MKKLLVLVVLAMATVAIAQPIWTYELVDGVVSVSIASNEGSLYIGLAVDPLEGVLSGFTPGANFQQAGPAIMAIVPDEFDPGYGQGEIWSMMDGATVPNYTDGEWLTASFAFAEGSTYAVVHVFEFFEDMSVVDKGEIVIPEPATIALLCLGGLLIRKK
jgi:hypothetical protein